MTKAIHSERPALCGSTKCEKQRRHRSEREGGDEDERPREGQNNVHERSETRSQRNNEYADAYKLECKQKQYEEYDRRVVRLNEKGARRAQVYVPKGGKVDREKWKRTSTHKTLRQNNKTG